MAKNSFSAYAQKLKDPRWQKMRLEIMQRDNFACLECESTTRTLEVHHCFYVKGDPWNSGAYLMTLCSECHKERQALENRIREQLGQNFLSTKIPDLKFLLMQLGDANREGNPLLVAAGEQERMILTHLSEIKKDPLRRQEWDDCMEQSGHEKQNWSLVP